MGTPREEFRDVSAMMYLEACQVFGVTASYSTNGSNPVDIYVMPNQADKTSQTAELNTIATVIYSSVKVPRQDMLQGIPAINDTLTIGQVTYQVKSLSVDTLGAIYTLDLRRILPTRLGI